MTSKINFKKVITYKPYFSYIFILVLAISVFFLYSEWFYVKPTGLLICLAIVLLVYIWGSFLISKNLELSIVGDNLIISDGKKTISIKLSEVNGFYFHDEAAINHSDSTEKGLASSITIYYRNGKVFEANEYSSLFMAEKYDKEKNVMFRAFLNALITKLNFKLIRKSKFRAFSNAPSSWYAQS
jgi:hypothetical protein